MNDIQESVKEIFENYLKKSKCRRTPERFKILFEIYQLKEHFSVEQLYLLMKNKNYNVSRATLYNTVELLTECKLIKKHQFSERTFFYEKSLKNAQHDHLMCNKCGKIIEFCDPRIQEIINDVSEQNKFDILSHELYFYGICSECKNK
jgi:Fur family ferric uptake transcriptional regulator